MAFVSLVTEEYHARPWAGWVAEPRDFTAAWLRLSAQSAHCFALVWETEHLRKLNQSLLAFLASAARPRRSLGTETLKSIPSLVLERGTRARCLHVSLQCKLCRCKLSQSLLAFLASAARPRRSLGTETLKSIPSLVLERGTHAHCLHVSLQCKVCRCKLSQPLLALVGLAQTTHKQLSSQGT